MRTIATIAQSILAVGFCAAAFAAQTATVSNPFLYADVPDISILRVDSTYFMSHTTMHMAPGVPIMASKDLVHWKTISYCYATLANSDALNLTNGKDAYGSGSWASSLRYKNGTYYCLVPSNTTGKTHLYTTKDPYTSNWKETILPFYHDPSLVLDDDGRNYVVYGQGDIRIVELNSDLSGVKSGGVNKVLLTSPASVAGSSLILPAEGSQVFKVDGYYYVFNICWPSGSSRTEIVYRSKSIAGPWEGKVVNKDQGVAQGGLVQMTDGKWMGYLFQDHGAVGRTPWLIPVTWASNWPDFNGGKAPATVTVPSMLSASEIAQTGIVTSDDFSGSTLHLEWQFNHNPVAANWSLTARPGYFRTTTGRVDNNILWARNALSQRTFGPKCSGRVALDASGLKDGDVAGLSAFADSLGFVGVKNSGGSLSIVKYKGPNVQEASVAISQKRVYLRIDMDYTNRTDKATFFYSLDSTTWKPIGNTLSMSYTLGMFMGYRFNLFNYATKTAGGYADFDWYKIGASASETINMYPDPVVPVAVTERNAAIRGHLSYRMGQNLSTIEVTAESRGPGHLELSLLDGNGRIVSSLVDGVHATGTHTMQLPVGHLSGGRYVLSSRLDGSLIASRSLVLVR